MCLIWAGAGEDAVHCIASYKFYFRNPTLALVLMLSAEGRLIGRALKPAATQRSCTQLLPLCKGNFQAVRS